MEYTNERLKLLDKVYLTLTEEDKDNIIESFLDEESDEELKQRLK